MRLRQKNVLITGAGSGIGKACSKLFFNEGANLVLTDLKDKWLDNSINDISKESGIEKICGDVSKKSEVKNIVNFAINKLGSLDILINCAGVNIDKPFLQMDDNSWDEVVNTHLKGTFISSQEFAKQYQGCSGHIITLGAWCGIQGRINGANFCSAKGGILALTKCMARELAPRIAVNCLTPSAVDTDEVMSRYNLDTRKGLEKVLSGIPMDRLGKREDVIQMTEAILSSKFTTGSNFFVNGGELMH